MNVILVVGGTGMLAGLSKRLSVDFDVVGVVARDKDKLDILSKHSDKIIAITADYTKAAEFKAVLDEFVKSNGRPKLIVSWIHSTSPEAAIALAKYSSSDFYDVTGESGKNAEHISQKRETTISDTCVKYHRVVLGHIGNRWLTNQEISDGVYAAIKADLKEFIVGEV